MKTNACVFFLIAAAGGCSSSGEGTSTDELTALRADVVKTYAQNLTQAYADSVADEQTFEAVVKAFLAAPTEETLSAARGAWFDSRAHYMLTEGARFYDGPIDDDDAAVNHEAAINSWPLDEAYIDYVTDPATMKIDDTAGFVNKPDLMPTIDVTAIDAANAQGGDENVSDGYHAQEFLLWGQALSPVGPGQRPATDYVVGGPRPNAERRAAYLGATIDGVLSHLRAVNAAWQPGASYRTAFEADPDGSLAKLFTGLVKFSKGELAEQRINAGYVSKSRRDQHDCFSSKTLEDYVRDAQGIQDLYLGKYGDTQGSGPNLLVKAADPDLNTKLEQQIQTSIDAIEAVPPPFEAAIAGEDSSPGRTAVLAAVNSLRTEGDLFGQAAAALGLTIQVDDAASAGGGGAAK